MIVKLFRRFCLILCAFSVFLNVTVIHAMYVKAIPHESSSFKSKQIAFQKNGGDVGNNPFESEEDTEIDEDGSGYDQLVSWNYIIHSTFDFTLAKVLGSKSAVYLHQERSAQLPLFLKYENLRI